MTRLFKILLLTSIIFFVLVLLLMLSEKLTFGYCLADLFPFFAQTGWIIILVIAIFIITRKKLKINKIFSGILSLILLTSIFFSVRGFTIDRGSCYPWNGRIFIMSKGERMKLQEEKLNSKLDSLNKIIELNPADYETITAKGQLLNKNEKWHESINEFKNAIATNPDYFDALYGLGDSYCEIEEYVKAVRVFEEAKEIDSTKNNVSRRIRNLKNYHKIE